MASTLFPPIVESWAPAFDSNEDIVISYNVSSYNNLGTDEGSYDVEFCMRRVGSNIPVMFTVEDPTTDKEKYIEYTNVSSVDRINKTIRISKSLVNLNAGCAYKLQIRFVINKGTEKSEWSRICLIKVINEPKLKLNLKENRITRLSSEFLTVEGVIADDDPEFLDSYEVTLSTATGQVIYTSPIQYTEEYSTRYIHYLVPYRLQNGVEYLCTLKYVTHTGYVKVIEYPFKVLITVGNLLNGEISAELDEEDGCMNISFNIFNDVDIDRKAIVILRSDNNSKFEKWEDLYTFVGLKDNIKDYTIKSGVVYKYGLQVYDAIESRRSGMVESEPVKAWFEHTFLTDKNMQFNVKFNPVINTYKRTVLESKTETIGSQYPFIRRNAKVYYRQFNLSGLISWQSDIRGTFLNEENVYTMFELYDKVRGTSEVADSLVTPGTDLRDVPMEDLALSISAIDNYDYTFEREFREKILDYLYNNRVKLFRSPTEGNLIVKLMNISLTPKKEISRLVYEFSCEVVELDDDNIDNYLKYDIIDEQLELSRLNGVVEDRPSLGQVVLELDENSPYFDGEDVLMRLMHSKYDSRFSSQVYIKDAYLTYLKMTFYGKPQSINIGNDTYVDGWKVIIDGSEIIVRSRTVYVPLFAKDLHKKNLALPAGPDYEHYVTGIYVANNVDNAINNIRFPRLSDKDKYKVYMEFTPVLLTEFDYGNKIVYTNTKTVLGQYNEEFEVGQPDSLIKYIRDKYLVNSSSYGSQLYYVSSLHIEGQPGTEFSYKINNTSYTANLGADGYFDIRTNVGERITQFAPISVTLKAADASRATVTYQDEYLDKTQTMYTTVPTAAATYNGVYNINHECYINYLGTWYDLNITDDDFQSGDDIVLDSSIEDLYIPMSITYKAIIEYNEYDTIE